jgi:carbamoyl-phosphate synthase small subunit
VNPDDDETGDPVAAGMVVKWNPTEPSNWRAAEELAGWLARRGRIAIGGVDTRRLTRAIRQQGAPHVALAHDPEGKFDLEKMVAAARGFAGLEGMDLAKDVTCAQSYRWDEMRWAWPEGYVRQEAPKHKVVAVDYGAKRNILRCLASAGCDVTVLPATATAKEVLAHNPDGVFLSNGPGDPAATGAYAVPMIREVLDKTDLPVFGICLGHQMLALALGATTVKMNHGHHGANHPVKDLETGKVEITSMNHGFAVDAQTLPDGVMETHRSLFDGSNCGIRMTDRPVYSVQYHPEASPGPQDSFYLFERFADAMASRKAAVAG